ncbi:hypothetical protein [Burkholderia ubonensis]|uniref:hypothetical protein n=1 Tax=Burkholderia ubonensis TaxID=101571 RepID=UPI000B25AE5B|nr:hypothetical protein [Burkholderia ubonensis]
MAHPSRHGEASISDSTPSVAHAIHIVQWFRGKEKNNTYSIGMLDFFGIRDIDFFRIVAIGFESIGVTK